MIRGVTLFVLEMIFAPYLKHENKLLRAGTASIVTQQQGNKRTRDDIALPGSTLQFRAPQSSTIVPS